MRTTVVLLALAAIGCDPPPTPAGEFVAVERDFRDFDRWTVFDRGPQPVGPMHPDGSSFVYVNRLPPPGATEFPTGTIVVRVTTIAGEVSEVHAMVKRGGDYNAEGARGWEYFDLSLPTLDPPIAPVITWRGWMQSTGDGYIVPDGGVVLSCNHCHASAVDNDSILGPELDLRSPR